MRDGFEERVGNAVGERGPESVAETACVLDGRETLLARDRGRDRPAVSRELPGGGRCIAVEPRRELARSERPEIAKEVVRAVDRPCLPSVGEPLQLELDLIERSGVEQLAEVLRAEQVAKQVPVERERSGTAFG